jgi:phage terminase large subunit
LIEVTGDPDDPKRAPRVDRQWALDQITKYGARAPWVLVNVFGKFPPASINALLGIEEVQEAMKRTLKEDAYAWAQKRLGIDVARFGDDLTVLFPRQGLAAFKPVPMSHPRGSPVSVDIANRVALAQKRWKHEMEFYDDTVGWAHGAIDIRRSQGANADRGRLRSPVLRSALPQHARLHLDEHGRIGSRPWARCRTCPS